MGDQVTDDIAALLRLAPAGPVKDAIWARYGDEIKARVAARAEASGWVRKGDAWERAA